MPAAGCGETIFGGGQPGNSGEHLSKFEPHSPAEKCGQGGHLAAGIDKHGHKLGSADLLISELDRGAQVPQLEVFEKLVLGGEAAGRPAEFPGIIPVEKLANRSPLRRPRHYCAANLEKGGRLRMP